MNHSDLTKSLPILIADDDADDRLLLEMAFAERKIPNPVVFFKDGCEITDYLSVKDTFGTEATHLPGLLLLDVNMPRKNGIQVLREIKAHPYWKHICVCMFSTARTDHHVSEAQQLGADNYVVKPDTYEDLLGIVQTIYDNWQHSAGVAEPLRTMNKK